jgi:thiol-disulfide isomerase/thioredoxin
MNREEEAKVRLSMEERRDGELYGQKTMSKVSLRLLLCTIAVFSWLCVAPLYAKRAPDPAFKALDGQTRKLSALHGQILVVNFWATWCGPCQEELPRLSQLAGSYADKPVRFVLISIDEAKNRAKIPAVLARLRVPLESWDDADTDTMDRFGLGDIVPGTVILDEKGEVVARIMGEAREDDVRKPVDWLLGGKAGPGPVALTKRY